MDGLDPDRDLVQPAFLARAVALPPPAARARILAGTHRARARLAADRAIAAVVQRVVRDLVGAKVLPHVGLAPFGERADFPQAPPRIVLGLGEGGAPGGLVASQARDPRALARERAAERLDL